MSITSNNHTKFRIEFNDDGTFEAVEEEEKGCPLDVKTTREKADEFTERRRREKAENLNSRRGAGPRERRGGERGRRRAGTGTHSATLKRGTFDVPEQRRPIRGRKKVRTAPPHVCEKHAQTRQRIAESYEGTAREANGYLFSWDATTRDVFEATESLLDGYHDDTKYFFRHVYASGSRSAWKRARWVPIYHGLWYGKLPYANPDALLDAGLIEKEEHSERKSAEYRVAPDVQAYLDDVLFDTLDGGEWVNLFTGKRTTKRAKTSAYDDERNRYPEVVVNGMKGMEMVTVNRVAARRHVAGRKRAYKHAMEAFEAASGVSYAEATERVREARRASQPMPYEGAVWQMYRDTEKAHSRYTVDLAALRGIARQVKTDLGGGVVECYAAYKPQSTGRITDRGILAQSATSEMKAQVFDMDNVYNYDLKSSQPRMLRQWFDLYHLPTQVLNDFLGTGKAKHAERVGLTVGAWKGALMALIMSATLFGSLSKGTKDDGTFRGSLPKIIAEGAVGDADEAYAAFYSYVQPLHKQLVEWRRYLRERWVPENVAYNAKGPYVKNAAGMIFYLNEENGEPKSAQKLNRKLPAFLLQGQEAFFIHTLVAIAPDYGFRPMANEHDGLITEGRIPETAIEAAKRVTGMDYAELVVKPHI